MSTPILHNKRAIVTGGSQGLGAALVERLLREGCRVMASDVQMEALEKLRSELSGRYPEALYIQRCDVTDEGDVRALVAAAAEQFGGLDIFVANAGILISGPITEFAVGKWRKVMEVNLVGQMLCMKHAIPAMQAAGGGSFIQINSKSGKKGSFKNSAYAASKFGGIGLVQSAALETVKVASVNAICPGNMLDSPLCKQLIQAICENQGVSEAEIRQRYINQVPMKRGCTYDDVCNLAVFWRRICQRT